MQYRVRFMEQIAKPKNSTYRMTDFAAVLEMCKM